MLGHRYEIARLHSDFYRDQFRKILRWIIISMVIIYILLAAIIYKIIFEPPQRYYGNTTEGLILDMPPPKPLK